MVVVGGHVERGRQVAGGHARAGRQHAAAARPEHRVGPGNRRMSRYGCVIFIEIKSGNG